MTDTDKLKRLAEAAKKVGGGWECTTEEGSDFIEAASPEAIISLIAENERLRAEIDTQRKHASYANQLMDQRVTAMLTRCAERDEAVALLREASIMHKDMHEVISAFLARIDGGV